MAAPDWLPSARAQTWRLAEYSPLEHAQLLIMLPKIVYLGVTHTLVPFEKGSKSSDKRA